MATNDDITISKGSNSVTLFSTNIAENWKNKLTVVPGVTSVSNQVNAPNKPQVVDLQRTEFTYVIEGHITKSESPSETAKAIKDRLRIIFEGSRIAGGTATLTYEDASIQVYFQDCVIKKVTNDNTVDNYGGFDSSEYIATVTLIEGEKA